MRALQDLPRLNTERKSPLNVAQLSVDFAVRRAGLLTLQDELVDIGGRDERGPTLAEIRQNVTAQAHLKISD